MPECLRSFTQAIWPVDHRHQRPRFEHISQIGQTLVCLEWQNTKSLVPNDRKHGPEQQIDKKSRNVAAKHHVYAVRTQGAHAVEYRSVRLHIENQIVTLSIPGEILLCVIDDMVGPPRAQQVQFFSAV